MTTVTVIVSMAIRRRGGRKQIIGPDGALIRASGDAGETRGDPALVKALARAFRWRRMLEEGRYGSIRELATAERVDRAYVGRLLNLTLLSPGYIEAILAGQEASIASSLTTLMATSRTWSDQSRATGPCGTDRASHHARVIRGSQVGAADTVVQRGADQSDGVLQ